MQRLLVLTVVAGLVGLVAAGGCKDDDVRAADPPPAAPRPLAGVYPENWRCDSIATPAQLGELLGGTVRQIDSPASVPRGVPRPCNYEVSATAPGTATEFWTFDLDCRDGMKQRADALFAQYKASSRDQVQRYEAQADAGAASHRSGDAGVELRAPEPAAEVFVGSKGLDHHGQGLIFVDDDAPCYVRVVGKDSRRRLELARRIAAQLTFANAPMTPRAFP